VTGFVSTCWDWLVNYLIFHNFFCIL
jgi:hypothetical protein